MPCGHLYCLACASFWFHQGDVPQACVMCRRAFKGEDIIKLWLTTETRSDITVHAEGEEGTSSAAAQDVLDACEAAVMNVDISEGDEALAMALSK